MPTRKRTPEHAQMRLNKGLRA
ncbi:MAG: hypothetical protein RLZZ271_1520, partial [Pseudomonadota bacterium]